MPRYPSQSSLPPLKKVLPKFMALENDRPKTRQVAELLQPVILKHRKSRNLSFYSTRDIASFFKVSQNTATLAVRQLEGLGLLQRVRGSQTLMLGTKVITRSHIRAVAGLLMWSFAEKYSEVHKDLTRCLAEVLWPHSIALDIIPHFDIGEKRPDLNDRLKNHAIDFAIWPFPFNHHKDHLLYLEDRGIRNLVISLDGVPTPFESNILIDIITEYKKVLRYWRQVLGIERIIVIEAREFTPRRRNKMFVRTAVEMGFDCQLETSSYTLAAEILGREKDRIGVALLDEHASAEFIFYQPQAFEDVARKHRILFGNGSISVPFVPHGEIRVDRIFIPCPPNSVHKRPLCTTIANTLVKWCSGDFTAPPEIIPAHFWENGELWRYL